MARQEWDWTEHFGSQFSPVFREWLHEFTPRLTISAECRFRIAEVAFQCHRGTIIERVGERGRRANPLQSIFLQRQ